MPGLTSQIRRSAVSMVIWRRELNDKEMVFVDIDGSSFERCQILIARDLGY